MLSKVDSRKKLGEDSGSGKLLNDIETISKALHLDKNLPRSMLSTVSSRSKSVGKVPMPESKPKGKHDKKDATDKDKDKKSIWSWKGLKALTHVRNRRFNCCFSLQVHSVEGLPPLFDDLSLIVHWKRRDGELMTRPTAVIQGMAEFEELLTHVCSIHGSRSGPHHSAKYEAKHFLLYVSVYGTPELDLGRHRVDLTRLLPLTLEELEEEKSSGKWTTSFKLSGKANGAQMNVSFGYEIIGDNKNKELSESQSFMQYSASTRKALVQNDHNHELSSIRRTGSLPARTSISQKSTEDIKDLHEVLPVPKTELSDSISLLYEKLDEEKLKTATAPVKPEVDIFHNPPEPVKVDLHLASDAAQETEENEFEVNEYTITDKGAELSINVQEKAIEDPEKVLPDCGEEGIDTSVSQVLSTEATTYHSTAEDQGEERLRSDSTAEETNVTTKESLLQDLESALSNVSALVKEESDSQDDEGESSTSLNHVELQSSSEQRRKGKSLSLDDVTEIVASDFLDLLGIEHSPAGLSSESEPESPRERLLRQFEKDTLASGCSLFNFGIDEEEPELHYDAAAESEWRAFSRNFDSSSYAYSSEAVGPKFEAESMTHKIRASTLEDLETEALMHEWGLNEKAFEQSPPSSASGFGSPIDLPPEASYPLPPLAEGLGPFVQTKDGGFLRSMNPALFSNAKSGGSLIMQVSNPVVMPAEMGSGVMDILQHLASVGIEKLSMQANKLMPLEDVTGMTMRQIAWEAAPSLDGPLRHEFVQHESGTGISISGEQERNKAKTSRSRDSKLDMNATRNSIDSEYVPLEDLAPLAMDKIEALAMEGLRIQSGMSDEDAPSNISLQSIGEFSAFEGKRDGSDGSLGLEGAGGLQLLDIKDNGGGVDGLMGLSLTLDEWMRLDSGEIDDGDHISEQTSRLLAAHHATSLESFRGRSKGEKRKGKGRNCGLLGNNFTVALMVQLRDPLRNYEPVGTPMLALIQVERVFLPPKPKMYCTVSLVKDRIEEDDETEPAKKDLSNEEVKEEELHEDEKVPQFKITEVHVAGLKTEPDKKKPWGSKTQQQSGSRWLLANGMGKKNKHPLLKSKVGGKSSLPTPSQESTTSQPQPGESLWSVSSRVPKWKERHSSNTHIRNPNVIFPNETMRLR
ncbi:OLC1v1037815C1 [Oldenlandia corymbosa var. corymbosa]|uniref:OLC1v1037815C1 n=1 Tax=Oldenlandia corymbosa var. corymbosa TaxID=529605 RepID=A0AAV1D1J1_OLDCO|nr:OLC1v1037815C1 [Oldenlandia corymbosa var. corymbosa]